MKKRILIVLILMALSVTLGGSLPTLAESPRKITGGFYSKGFFGIEQGWFNFNVHEVGAGEANGSCEWKEYKESDGWRRVQAHPVCVAFDEENGQPAAAFVVQVDRIRGWKDPAEFEGQYMKFWVVDGGTPGSKGDQWGTAGLGPWPPTGNLDDYGCHYAVPVLRFQVAGGNLVVHD